LTPAERETAVLIVRKIADNAHHLTAFRDEFVGLDAIPELRAVSKRMMDYRKDWSVTELITNLLGRTTSKNTAVATASMRELRDVLCNQQKDIIQLSRGDMFDPLVSKISRTLLTNATRDGDSAEIKDLSYECIGIIGALDPDRILPMSGGVTVSLHSNFADHDESIDFALHLIRDLLVDAFRATNDTKHQSYLAYAIQQLLKFCDFTPKVLHSDRNLPAKTRSKWSTIPKDQHETLAPLLESRFQLHDLSSKPVERPVYPQTSTYREWLQKWTTDLVGQIMSIPSTDRGTQDCKTIFGVFRGVLKSQDVAVAHHILPYLVLTLLLLGSTDQRREICAEINTVLLDQVASASPTTADKRMLSSQVIFDLMDHLSKWLRQNRVTRTGTTDRTNHVKAVENVLSSIESELMANAALQSKAYARSLRSFEQRLYQLKRVQKREDQDLQEYYERIHQIYAELDEPDGMEGISTFVIAPSLEHQIREHESTGRWTSAQSCWEVRLQQDPDDVKLHVGLLKCLRNLGHYGTLADTGKAKHADVQIRCGPISEVY
jgi:serine/threonine-protein kinase ATR